MKFRTEIEIEDKPGNIEHFHRIITLGSCFAENIAGYFEHYKFRVMNNPFGVLYNPVSILNSLKIAEEQKRFTKEDLIFDQTEWHSFYHHSDFSNHDADACLEKINTVTSQTYEFLKIAEVMIVTFGTSFVFKHRKKSLIVSNCHKIPGNEFDHYMLSHDQNKTAINSIIHLVRKINPEVRIIFTVSPIRHWKNGAVGNQLSKANLIVSLHEALMATENTYYFPSYEIMMDDLRDYRFYEADLLHPNKIATDYIWEKFSQSFLSEKSLSTISEVDKIVKLAGHKPRNSNSAAYRMYIDELKKQIGALEQKYEYIDFSQEKTL